MPFAYRYPTNLLQCPDRTADISRQLAYMKYCWAGCLGYPGHTCHLPIDIQQIYCSAQTGQHEHLGTAAYIHAVHVALYSVHVYCAYSMYTCTCTNLHTVHVNISQTQGKAIGNCVQCVHVHVRIKMNNPGMYTLFNATQLHVVEFQSGSEKYQDIVEQDKIRLPNTKYATLC